MISNGSLALLCFLVLLETVTIAFHLDTQVRVSGSAVTPVDVPTHVDLDSNTLTEYMRLPVEQYALVPMPLNATLSRIPSNNKFELRVPPMRFLWLEVQPVVEADVALEPHRVVISSDKCRLIGSPFLSKVQMNERFNFSAYTELTWNDARNENSTISAQTLIEVDVDRPFPFRTMPKRAIEKVGNTAMRLSMNFILKSFLQGLASDYQLWASDATYRARRSELAIQVGYYNDSHTVELSSS